MIPQSPRIERQVEIGRCVFFKLADSHKLSRKVRQVDPGAVLYYFESDDANLIGNIDALGLQVLGGDEQSFWAIRSDRHEEEFAT